MRHTLSLLCAAAFLSLSIGAAVLADGQGPDSPEDNLGGWAQLAEPAQTATGGAFPPRFEPSPGGGFLGANLPVPIHLDRYGALLDLGGQDVRIGLPAPSSPAQAATSGAYTNYFLGSGPDSWRTSVPHVTRVHYPEVADGIDAAFYVTADGSIEFDFILAPGADPEDAWFQVSDADARILSDGALELVSGGASVIFDAPEAYQDRPGGQAAIPVTLREDHGGRFSFDVGPYNPDLPLVIDPRIVYSSYYGGGDTEEIRDAAFAPDGDIVLTGVVSNRGFVARFDGATGALEWSSLFGSSTSSFSDLAVGAAGIAVAGDAVAGFPTTATAYQTTNLGSDAVVALTTHDGATLQYGTYIGGGTAETGGAVSLTGTKVAVGGRVHFHSVQAGQNPFPTTDNAFQTVHSGPYPAGCCGASQATFGGFDGFIAVLDTAKSGDASLLYSTYYGGGNNEEIRAMGFAPDGTVLVAGRIGPPTGSTAAGPASFPAQGGSGGSPFRTGTEGTFLSRLDPAQADGADTLVFSTFIGQSSTDYATDLVPDASGGAYVAGTTNWNGLIPASAAGHQATISPNDDAWVAHIDSDGADMLAGTYSGLPGSGCCAKERGIGLSVAPGGDVLLLLSSPADGAASAPERNQPWQDRGGTDFVLARYSDDLAKLRHRMVVGGQNEEMANIEYRVGGVDVDSEGRVLLAGYTRSSGFPVTDNAAQASKSSTYDAVILILDKLPPTAVITATPDDPAYPPVTTVGTQDDVVHAFITKQNSTSLPTLIGVDLTANNTFLGDADVGVPGTSDDLDTYTYTWDIGNDTTIESTDRWLTGLPELNLSKSGKKEVCLTVDDGTGVEPHNTTTCITITWTNRPPEVDLTRDFSIGDPVPLCTPVPFTASAQDLDGTIGRFDWDFDWSSPWDGVVDATNLTFDAAGDKAWANQTHLYRESGAYLAYVNATDDEDAHGEAFFGVAVEDPGVPVAVDDTFQVSAGQSIAIDALAYNTTLNDCDPDDASLLTAVLDTPPTNSAGFQLEANGTFTYTAPPGGAGTDSFTYHVENPDGDQSAPATVTIVILGAPEEPPDPANTAITADPSQIVADGTTTSTVTVQLKDANDNHVTPSDAAVCLAATAGTLSSTTGQGACPAGEIQATFDAGSGNYTATLTSTTTPGTATITGTLDGQAITDDAAVDFVAGAADTTQSTITADPTQIVAGGTDASAITVQLKDSNGNDHTTGGAVVCLSKDLGNLASTTGTGACASGIQADDPGDGTYTAIFSSTVTGTATITAMVDGQAITDDAQVTIVAGPADPGQSTISASPTNVPADGSSTSAITVQLRDASGNALADGGDVVCLSTSPVGQLQSSTGAGACVAGETQADDQGDGSYAAALKSGTPGIATVTAGLGASSIGDVAVTFFDPNTNTGPTAFDDSYTTDFGTPFSVPSTGRPGVLDNDEDDEGDPLTATLDSGPARHQGTFTLGSSGSFTYDPDLDPAGYTDSFTYTVTDGQYTDTGTVTITVEANQAPTTQDDPDYTALYETVLTVDAGDGILENGATDGLLQNDDDPEGLSLQAVAATGFGTDQGGLVDITSDGSFTYTPPTGYYGPDSFTYQATDGHATTPATVYVEVLANAPPTAVDDDADVDEDGSVDIDVAANDNDPDPNHDQSDLVVTAVSTPTPHGTAEVLGDGHTVRYTPGPDRTDPATFTYTIEDPVGATDTAIVAITVSPINDAPVASPDGPYSVVQPNSLTIAAPGVLANDDDKESSPSQLTAGPVTTPAGLSLQADGGFTYQPPGGFTGQTSFSYRACDPDGACSQPVTVIIDVQAPPPRAAAAQQELEAPDPPTVPDLRIDARAGDEVFIPAGLPHGAGGSAVLVWDQATGPPVTLAWDAGQGGYVFTAPTLPPGASMELVYLIAVRDGGRVSEAVEVVVHVDSENTEPVARAEARPSRVVAGQEVLLDASGSYDPDGQALSYHWQQFGGAHVELQDASTPRASFVAPRVEDDSQELVFVVVVGDSGGKHALANVTVTYIQSLTQATTGNVIDADFRAFHRGQGQILFRATGNEAARYVWDLGDGNTAIGPEVLHRYEEGGDFTVRLSVEDGEGTGSASKPVSVPDYAPVHEAKGGGAGWWLLGAAAAVSLLVIAVVALLALRSRK